MVHSVVRRSLSRRSVMSGLLAVPFAVAGCTEDEGRRARPTATTSPPPSPRAAKPAVTGKGLPADLLAAVGVLYLGGAVVASADVGKALAARRLAKTSLEVGGSTGSWHGSPIAVVTRGRDVTLLVKAPRWTVVGGWWPSLGVARVARPPMRVLAIGSDARSGQQVERSRADALQLIGVDNRGVGGVVGLPRDSYVRLASGGSDKLNAALAFGGVRGQVQTVVNATGVPVDGYVMAGFAGFRKMVTALGGIVFPSQTALRSVDGYLILRPGTNRLTAQTALGLARERKNVPGGDFGRSANQGRLIKAGLVMARAQGPGRLPRYLTAMSPHLATDLSTEQVLNLAAAVYLTNPAALRTAVAQGTLGTRGGQSVVLLGAPAKALFRDIEDGRLG